jgi:hypothetical protein
VNARDGRARWWITSPLFRSYLAAFLILWVLAKTAIAGGAALAGLEPFAFQPYYETWACALELLTLAHFIHRRGEDVLLGNLGLGLGTALLPLALAHAALSGAVAVLVS